MRCQYCNCTESKVIDSRPTEEGNSIRRRRECVGCGRRFTTYEKIEQLPLMVVKRDGRREPFAATKIKGGILHACEKLPVSMQQIDAMTARIEQSAYAAMEDPQGRLENFYLGQAIEGRSDSPEDLAREMEETPAERIFRAMSSVKLDTVYYLERKEEKT